jgi:hypothetical protein
MRGRPRSLGAWALWLYAVSASTALACGSRTGLLVPPPQRDAAVSEEASLDSGEEAAADAGPDATEEDAPEELPSIDGSFPDAPNPCDGGQTLVYLITQENQLLGFDPASLSTNTIGIVACPTMATPFSMAVNRQGIAYSLFGDGTLWRIDTGTAACTPTSFAPDQAGIPTFGMGYVADVGDGGPGGDAGETLYVDQEMAGGGGISTGLAWIDTTTMVLNFIGPFSPPVAGMEMTGTADGRLFGSGLVATGGSQIAEIDRATARIVASTPLSVGQQGDAWAFAFWGGSFWVFTSPGGTTTVTRFDPMTNQETTATTINGTVVGAGVSTCAPL